MKKIVIFEGIKHQIYVLCPISLLTKCRISSAGDVSDEPETH